MVRFCDHLIGEIRFRIDRRNPSYFAVEARWFTNVRLTENTLPTPLALTLWLRNKAILNSKALMKTSTGIKRFGISTALAMVALLIPPFSAQASAPSWVDFDDSESAPYVGSKSQPYVNDISTVHAVGSNYYFFRGPELYIFDPATPATPPQLVAITPPRRHTDTPTGNKLETYQVGSLLVYSGTTGVWVFDTTDGNSYEILDGATQLSNLKSLHEFNGVHVMVAQIQGSTTGTGWGIYSVDLTTRSGTPETYSATLRKSTSFVINSYGGFASSDDLLFFSEGNPDASLWVMDTEWDSEALVDLNDGSNTQAGNLVLIGDTLGFKARVSTIQSDQGHFFLLDTSGINATSVDGTVESLIREGDSRLTQLFQLNSSPFNVSQTLGLRDRYIVIGSQNGSAHVWDLETSEMSVLIETGTNWGFKMKPYVVTGHEYVLIAIGTELRGYDPTDGAFITPAPALNEIASNLPIYESSVMDANGDGNSNFAAIGFGTWGTDQRWFFAPIDTSFAPGGDTSEETSAPTPYTGPVLSSFSTRTLDPCIATAVRITGSNLLGAKPSIQGREVTVLENTDTKLVLAFPKGLTAATGENLIVASNAGTLTFQNAFDISEGSCAQEESKGRWTQLQSDGKTVKMYAKDPIGDGKIQFFKDGKEIAWINAVDESDPKLSFASGFPYLVRSVELNEGKNRFEIKLDGVRVWRATYVPKG